MSIVEKTTSFVQSAYVESKKVTWPSRRELRESTVVVIIATIFIMLYLFVVDRILSLILGIFL